MATESEDTGGDQFVDTDGFDPGLILAGVDSVITDIEDVTGNLQRQLSARSRVASNDLAALQISLQGQVMQQVNRAAGELRPVGITARTAISERISAASADAGRIIREVSASASGEQPGLDRQNDQAAGRFGDHFGSAIRQTVVDAVARRATGNPEPLTADQVDDLQQNVGVDFAARVQQAAEDLAADRAGNGRLSGSDSSLPACPLCGESHQPGAACPPGSVCLAPGPAADIQPSPSGCFVPSPGQPGADLAGDCQLVVWLDAVNRQVYFRSPAAGPRSPADIRVGAGAELTAALADARRNCQAAAGIAPPETPGPSGIDELLKLPQRTAGCTADFYVSPGTTGTPITSGDVPKLGKVAIPSPGELLKQLAQFQDVSATQRIAIELFSGIAEGFADQAQDAAEQLTKSLHCVSPDALGAFSMLTLMGFLERYAVPDLDTVKLPFKYLFTRNCPTGFPTVEQANVALLANTIGPGVWESWVNIQNQCSDPQKLVVNAMRTKPTGGDLAVMRHRGIITPSDYAVKMREAGYMKGSDHEQLFRASFVLPPLSEVIRYMVRDVEDEQNIDWRQADAQFEDKFKGNVKRWTLQQGITEDIMKASWRAHFFIPSPRELFEMLHRLRPGRVPGNLVTNEARIRKALIQQDIEPSWVDNVMAISFRPLTRVDVRRAFNIGELTKAQVVEANMDLGYERKNAEVLAEFAESLKNRGVWSDRNLRAFKAGVMTRAEAAEQLGKRFEDAELIDRALAVTAKSMRGGQAAKLFSRGCITRQEAEQRLQQQGLRLNEYEQALDDAASCKKTHRAVGLFAGCLLTRAQAQDQMQADGMLPAIIADLLDDAAEAMRLKRAGPCIEGIKQQFFMGALDDAQIIPQLQGQGMTVDCALAVRDAWQCEQNAAGKLPSTAQLCKWLEAGIINNNDMLARLLRIGWKRADALNVLAACLAKINAAGAKQGARKAAGQVKQAEREERQAKKTEAQLAAEAEKARKKAEVMKRAVARREAMLLKAADKYHDLASIGLNDSVNLLRSVLEAVRDAQALTIDESLQAVVRAVESLKPDQANQVEVIALELAQQLADMALEDSSSSA